jgi:predicted SAM-dependent methyltransferase
VIRISVPDADYRTYAAPEPVGYPSPKVPWSHHQKHLMRWNVDSLSEVLRIAGFTPRPVIYCTQNGEFHQELPGAEATDTLEPELLSRTDYMRRLPSLVVDGIKPA